MSVAIQPHLSHSVVCNNRTAAEEPVALKNRVSGSGPVHLRASRPIAPLASCGRTEARPASVNQNRINAVGDGLAKKRATALRRRPMKVDPGGNRKGNVCRETQRRKDPRPLSPEAGARAAGSSVPAGEGLEHHAGASLEPKKTGKALTAPAACPSSGGNLFGDLCSTPAEHVPHSGSRPNTQSQVEDKMSHAPYLLSGFGRRNLHKECRLTPETPLLNASGPALGDGWE